MKIKDLNKVQFFIHDLMDFFTSNSDGDTSGLFEETSKEYEEILEIIKNEKSKIYLKNALQRVRRKRKNQDQ